jgi:hypothetical protein
MIMAMEAKSALATVWEALHEFRDICIPEGQGWIMPKGQDSNDDQWDDICEAMAFLHESLGVDQGDI